MLIKAENLLSNCTKKVIVLQLYPNKQGSVRVDDRLELKVSDLGSQVFFTSFSLNISLTGILFVCNDVSTFNKESILELIIDPESKKLPEPVYALVQIARIAKGDSIGLEKYQSQLNQQNELKSVMGVFFKQFKGQAHEIWEDYLNKLYDKIS